VNGQATLVPDAAIALDLDQTLDVHADHAAQVTLDGVLFIYYFAQPVDLFFCEVADASIRIDICLIYYLLRAGRPDTVNVGKGYLYTLMRGTSTPAILAMNASQ